MHMTNEDLVIEYKNGNLEALNQLIEQNLGMVHRFAHKYSSLCQTSFLDVDDLIQEGMIGIIKAAEKYNPEGDALFSTYAYKTVMGKIYRSVNKYIPREKKSVYKGEILAISNIHESVPGLEDVTLEDIIPFEKEVYEDVEREIDNKILKRDLIKLLDVVFEDEDISYTICESDDANIKSCIHRIKQKVTSKDLIILHYGLFGKRMSFNDIANYVDLSVQRLAFIEAEGIHKIRISDHVITLVENYGYDFGITVNKWKENLNYKTFSENMESEIDSLGQFISTFI